MRTINLTCRIVADAEKRVSTKTGKEYLYLRVANNEYNDEKDASGNPKTSWFTVFIGEQQLGLQKFLTKGKPIIVVGDYKDGLYKRNDGTLEISREIRAHSIYFVDNGNSNSDGQNGGQKTAQTATTTSAPLTQTTMTPPAPKPTTADIKVPQPTTGNSDEDNDDLPF